MAGGPRRGLCQGLGLRELALGCRAHGEFACLWRWGLGRGGDQVRKPLAPGCGAGGGRGRADRGGRPLRYGREGTPSGGLPGSGRQSEGGQRGGAPRSCQGVVVETAEPAPPGEAAATPLSLQTQTPGRWSGRSTWQGGFKPPPSDCLHSAPAPTTPHPNPLYFQAPSWAEGPPRPCPSPAPSTPAEDPSSGPLSHHTTPSAGYPKADPSLTLLMDPDISPSSAHCWHFWEQGPHLQDASHPPHLHLIWCLSQLPTQPQCWPIAQTTASLPRTHHHHP